MFLHPCYIPLTPLFFSPFSSPCSLSYSRQYSDKTSEHQSDDKEVNYDIPSGGLGWLCMVQTTRRLVWADNWAAAVRGVFSISPFCVSFLRRRHSTPLSSSRLLGDGWAYMLTASSPFPQILLCPRLARASFSAFLIPTDLPFSCLVGFCFVFDLLCIGHLSTKKVFASCLLPFCLSCRLCSPLHSDTSCTLLTHPGCISGMHLSSIPTVFFLDSNG